MATPCKTLDLGGSTFYSEFDILSIMIPPIRTSQVQFEKKVGRSGSDCSHQRRHICQELLPGICFFSPSLVYQRNPPIPYTPLCQQEYEFPSFLKFVLNQPMIWVGFARILASTTWGISTIIPSKFIAHLWPSGGCELKVSRSSRS